MWHLVLLGVVQGLTEFFPISSDGHLAVFQVVFGMKEASLALDVALHAGTLGAMLVFFHKDIWAIIQGVFTKEDTPERALERRRILYIVIATVFTGVVGLALKEQVEAKTASLTAAGMGFLVTAVLLFSGEWGARRSSRMSMAQVPWWHMILMGLIQGAAVWPGWSRSGSTIAMALILGWTWQEAGRFSFIMAIPAIAGATLLTAKDMTGLDPLTTLVGIAVSFGVGCLALWGLMKFLAAKKLWPFALYCVVIGVWALWRG